MSFGDPKQLILLFVALFGAAMAFVVLGNFSRPKFVAKPLINKSEIRLFWMVTKQVPHGFRVMAQVSYGEILRCQNRRKFFTINAKRADLVICDRDFNVVAVIEYQGGGHYGSTAKARKDAISRDRQKRRALSEAGVPLVEIPAQFGVDLVSDALGPVLADHRQPSVRKIA